MYPTILAKSHPDKAAYVMAGSGEAVSYRELDERSNQGAQLFRSLGLRPGDAIAILLENHPRFFEICWAAQRSGLWYTPISYRLTAPEVEYIVRDCGAKVLIASDATRDVAVALAPRLADLSGRFLVGGDLRGLRELGSRRRALSPQRRSRTSSKARTCSTRPAPPAGPRASSSRVGAADRHAHDAGRADEGPLRRRRARRLSLARAAAITPRRCASACRRSASAPPAS